MTTSLWIYAAVMLVFFGIGGYLVWLAGTLPREKPGDH